MPTRGPLLRSVTFGIVAVSVSQCGGIVGMQSAEGSRDAGLEETGFDGSSDSTLTDATDGAASAEAAEPLDASSCEGPFDASSCEGLVMTLLGNLPGWPSSAWEGGCGYVFFRKADYLGFFDYIAEQAGFVDPAHQVDCRPDAGPCNYDPSGPRLDPMDVYYSDAYRRFLAPDGRPYVWTYVCSQNAWFAADASRAPQLYELLLAINRTCPAGCPGP